MRIQFEATFSDLVDVSMRLYTSNGALRKYRSQCQTSLGLMVALFLFALYPGPVFERLGAGLVAFALGAIVAGWSARSWFRSNLARTYQNLRGDRAPFLVVCEINEDELRSEHDGMRIAWDWSRVTRIDDEPDAIVFWMQRGQLFVVRKRAFGSPEEEARFVELARQYQAEAKPKPAEIDAYL